MILKLFPKKRLISIKLYNGVDEKEIEDNKYYSIVSTGFCFPIEPGATGGDDFRKLYDWFTPRNPEIIHVGKDNLSRDILINFLRNIDELKGNKYYNQKEQRMRLVG
jgi:hypothetical protein